MGGVLLPFHGAQLPMLPAPHALRQSRRPSNLVIMGPSTHTASAQMSVTSQPEPQAWTSRVASEVRHCNSWRLARALQSTLCIYDLNWSQERNAWVQSLTLVCGLGHVVELICASVPIAIKWA